MPALQRALLASPSCHFVQMTNIWMSEKVSVSKRWPHQLGRVPPCFRHTHTNDNSAVPPHTASLRHKPSHHSRVAPPALHLLSPPLSISTSPTTPASASAPTHIPVSPAAHPATSHPAELIQPFVVALLPHPITARRSPHIRRAEAASAIRMPPRHSPFRLRLIYLRCVYRVLTSCPPYRRTPCPPTSSFAPMCEN